MYADIENTYRQMPATRDRDLFLREILREMAGTLESVVGLEQASGFISLVGSRLGEVMNSEYRAGSAGALDREHVAAALVDLKRRIKGGFSIESIDEDRIVLVNTACPFGKHVQGRKSLCMMTSNVFGRIAAENLGYARVELSETIADGDGRCRVIVDLASRSAADTDIGLEYFATDDVAG